MPILMHEHNGVRLYHEYSTIAEGPLCPAMTREEFTAHYESQGGVDLAERLARADAHGSSSLLGSDGAPLSFEDVILGNNDGLDPTAYRA